jgi:hypothetical protein
MLQQKRTVARRFRMKRMLIEKNTGIVILAGKLGWVSSDSGIVFTFEF